MQNKIQRKEVAGLEIIEYLGDPGGLTIIALHGFGADAMDLTSLSRVYEVRPRPTWIFPNAPLKVPVMPGYNGRAWFPIDIESLQASLSTGNFETVTKAFSLKLEEPRRYIERLIGELGISRSKLILGGFSQGAILAVETALHEMGCLAALFIFSGTLVCEPKWRQLSHSHRKMPFFQSHGTHDPILPVSRAQKLEKLLLEGGLQGQLHMFEGGHEIPKEVMIKFHTFLSLIN